MMRERDFELRVGARTVAVVVAFGERTVVSNIGVEGRGVEVRVSDVGASGRTDENGEPEQQPGARSKFIHVARGAGESATASLRPELGERGRRAFFRR